MAKSNTEPQAGAEAKKESFRKYLDSAGVVDSLTKVLVALYEEPERPENPVEFVMQSLGAKTPAEYDKVVAERDELQQKVDELSKRVQELEESKNAKPEGTEQHESNTGSTE